jgi:hypothetical protein
MRSGRRVGARFAISRGQVSALASAALRHQSCVEFFLDGGVFYVSRKTTPASRDSRHSRAEVVDDAQDPKAAAVGERVG